MVLLLLRRVVHNFGFFHDAALCLSLTSSLSPPLGAAFYDLHLLAEELDEVSFLFARLLFGLSF